MRSLPAVPLCLCLGLVLTSLSGRAQPEVLAELDAYLTRSSTYLGDCPYAVVVSQDGKIIHERYHDGAQAIGPVDQSSRWFLYSISKSYAAALILHLVQEGVVALDDPISKYLPAFETKGMGTFDRRDVTIRHLASHTSGAFTEPDSLSRGRPRDLHDIKIVTAPGGPFLYSSLGTHLLELTLEAATGQDYETLLQERVLEPLGLSHTGFQYDSTPYPTPLLPIRPETYQYAQKGNRVGSGLSSTARDLNAFGNFWLNPSQLFSPELRQEAWQLHGIRDSDRGRYGLLWWLFEDQGGYVMSGHALKVNAVIPHRNVVVTVIRYPQNDASFDFFADKLAFVNFGNRL